MKWYLDKQRRLLLPLQMSLIGKKSDTATVNVTVICRLSLTLLMGSVAEPFKSNVYLLGEI